MLPLVLPLIRLPLAEHSAVAAYRIDLPEVVIGRVDKGDEGFSWAAIALWPYSAVTAALLLLYGRSYILLFRKLLRGKREKRDGYTLITSAGIGPGTIGKRIFFPGSEVNAAILRHELGHIRAGHRYDAALLQVMHVALWASPAHWLMRRELKLVHEYEADRAAVSSASEQAAYGELMLSQSLGITDTTIAHLFFHHPLKLRIMMLQKTNIRRKNSLVIAACMLTSIFITSALFAQTKRPKSVNRAPARHSASNAAKAKAGDFKTTSDGRVVYKLVEQMPAFNGNLSEWLASNLVYPDAARKANHQGKSVVQFIVNNDGRVSDAMIVRSSGHPLLDNEALRAVNAMPSWNAGMHDGEAVPVYFTLPIGFKLD